jgi:hypothetical protein
MELLMESIRHIYGLQSFFLCSYWCYAKREAPPSPIIINGCRPLAITKAEFFRVLRSPRIGQRALYWTRRGQPFVKILRQGGRGCTLVIDTLSAEIFYADLLEGKCEPPPMPGECKKDLPE